jgi:hypothetical protein
MNIKNVYNKISDPKFLLREKEKKFGDKMLGRKSIFVLALCSEKADHMERSNSDRLEGEKGVETINGEAD